MKVYIDGKNVLIMRPATEKRAFVYDMIDAYLALGTLQAQRDFDAKKQQENDSATITRA
jgi:hypothetical protein